MKRFKSLGLSQSFNQVKPFKWTQNLSNIKLVITIQEVMALSIIVLSLLPIDEIFKVFCYLNDIVLESFRWARSISTQGFRLFCKCYPERLSIGQWRRGRAKNQGHHGRRLCKIISVANTALYFEFRNCYSSSKIPPGYGDPSS